MDKEFVPYQEAFELKKLGFNEECFWWYGFEKYLRKDRIGTSTNYSYFLENKSCSAPLYSQAFKWFREKHNLYQYIEPSFDCIKLGYQNYSWLIKLRERVFIKNGTFKTYEEAELDCLKKLIEIIK